MRWWSARETARRFDLVPLVVLAFLLVTLSPGLAAALAGAPVTITIGSSLDPSSVTIEPGTSVTWVNADSASRGYGDD